MSVGTVEELKALVGLGQLRGQDALSAAASLMRELVADLRMAADSIDDAAKALEAGEGVKDAAAKAAVQVAVGRRAMEEAHRETGHVFDTLVYVGGDAAEP